MEKEALKRALRKKLRQKKARPQQSHSTFLNEAIRNLNELELPYGKKPDIDFNYKFPLDYSGCSPEELGKYLSYVNALLEYCNTALSEAGIEEDTAAVELKRAREQAYIEYRNMGKSIKDAESMRELDTVVIQREKVYLQASANRVLIHTTFENLSRKKVTISREITRRIGLWEGEMREDNVGKATAKRYGVSWNALHGSDEDPEERREKRR